MPLLPGVLEVRALRQTAKMAVIGARHRKNDTRRQALGYRNDTLPAALWNTSVNDAGHLEIGGCDSVHLARDFGTPLHVVNKDRLVADFERFHGAFARCWPEVILGTSYKTNPLPGVIRQLHQLGSWAEVISHFELWLAIQLGMPGGRIIYNGPGKTRESIRLAVGHDLALINLDNASEVDQVAAEAQALGRIQKVGIRVVTSVGWSGQFGNSIASGEALAMARRIVASDGLSLAGLHIHLGTGLKHLPTYLQAIREVCVFAQILQSELGVTLSYLDFGGGFGVPTVRPMDEWDQRLQANGYPPGPIDPSANPTPETFAQAVTGLLREFYDPGHPGNCPTLIFEPGRAITSSAQTLLLSVIAIKPGPNGSRKVILDGGKNITIPLGYELHEVLPASKMNSPYGGQHQLYGPLCHPGDILVLWKRLPDLEPGDVVAIMDAGAYFIPNQMNFSNPRPAVVMAHDGTAELIRAREQFDDIVRLDQLVD